MWTPDHSYWRQKKNSSYYPALFEIPFPSWKITENFNFPRKNSHFPLKKKKPKMVWIVWGVFFLALPRVHMKNGQILTGNEAFLGVLFSISSFKNGCFWDRSKTDPPKKDGFRDVCFARGNEQKICFWCIDLIRHVRFIKETYENLFWS